MAQATLTEMGLEGALLAGSRQYGQSFLEAVTEAIVTFEQLAFGKRDQGGNLTTKQTPAQILPRVILESWRRLEGTGTITPVDCTPIPETMREVSDTVTPRDLVADTLYDFLVGCQWARATGLELVLADHRAYVRAGAVERALDRIEVVYDALLKAPRLPPDRDVMELKERVRVLGEMVSEARDRGFVSKGEA